MSWRCRFPIGMYLPNEVHVAGHRGEEVLLFVVRVKFFVPTPRDRDRAQVKHTAANLIACRR